MIIAVLCLTVVLVMIVMLFFRNGEIGESLTTSSRILVLLLGYLAVIIFMNADEIMPRPKTPSALDVYRGRTTIEVTYRDSVATDTVVVWKKK